MRTISFFSYKGGSCRSTTAYNTIPFIARDLGATENEPIIIIDTDIDSAGMTLLLEQQNDLRGTVDELIIEAEDIEGHNADPEQLGIDRHPFFRKMSKVGRKFALADGTVRLLGSSTAGGKGELSHMEDNLETIKKLCAAYNCRAIIFDTPSGTQFAARRSINASDTVVVCMRPTYQFRTGTKEFLMGEHDHGGKRRYLICPTAVSLRESVILRSRYPQDIKGKIEEEVVNPVNQSFEQGRHKLIDGLLERAEGSMLVGIPEVERFKWSESCLYQLLTDNIDDLNADDTMAIERYELLSRLICEQ